MTVIFNVRQKLEAMSKMFFKGTYFAQHVPELYNVRFCLSSFLVFGAGVAGNADFLVRSVL